MGSILVIILVGIFSLFTRNLAGEGGGLSKGDERQKIIFKDASITSWQVILFYALLRLLAITPFIKQLFVNEKTSIFLSNSFFTNGGDILVVGLLGYTIGIFGSYIKRTQI
ncbi:hypothetical protein [Bacillus wiedmannii]|uniref:Uncharacterized protein n=1 Tax=Bacillus wiedmannii TaxID=1890302 RepID=A0AB37YMZ0_9BACI|nr:hypothetical protein [Bacillus wiedmannii]SCB92433.1 Uncharacterized protein BC10311_00762 [Bacillus wiedmannii]